MDRELVLTLLLALAFVVLALVLVLLTGAWIVSVELGFGAIIGKVLEVLKDPGKNGSVIPGLAGLAGAAIALTGMLWRACSIESEKNWVMRTS
ncbi:MAG: hypothetical protein ACTHK7_01210 [Aureliella sp.]